MTFDPFKNKISDLNNLEPSVGLALIAEPFMEDGYFRRAVVLIAEYNEKGIIGFILNSELELSINDVMEDFPEFNAPLFLGGPVEPQSLFYIHCVPELITDSIQITEHIYWNGDFESLKLQIKAGNINPRQIKFFLGYSGWGKEQLAEELKSDSWLIQKIKEEQVLRIKTDNLWKEVVLSSKKREINLMANFPEDPSLN